jgi:hypothetical protein
VAFWTLQYGNAWRTTDFIWSISKDIGVQCILFRGPKLCRAIAARGEEGWTELMGLPPNFGQISRFPYTFDRGSTDARSSRKPKLACHVRKHNFSRSGGSNFTSSTIHFACDTERDFGPRQEANRLVLIDPSGVCAEVASTRNNKKMKKLQMTLAIF